jgi:hypothetical protein
MPPISMRRRTLKQAKQSFPASSSSCPVCLAPIFPDTPAINAGIASPIHSHCRHSICPRLILLINFRVSISPLVLLQTGSSSLLTRFHGFAPCQHDEEDYWEGNRVGLEITRRMPPMQSRRALPTPQAHHHHHHRSSSSSRRNWFRFVVIVGAIVLVSVAGPLYFLLTTKGDNSKCNRISSLFYFWK